MSEVRIRTKLESDTPHLPELRSMIGKDVEIVVTEQDAATPSVWADKTLEQLAKEQGITKPATIESLLGILPAELFDGFDEWLEEQRKMPDRERDF